jgi:hypothetical protein
LRDADDRRAQLEREFRALYHERVRAHGCTLSDARVDALLALDIGLNAAGIEVWLNRDRK